MERICVFSLALLSTLIAGSTVVAGPLSPNPRMQRQSAPPPGEAPSLRQTASPGQFGGGFVEMLFRGPGASTYETNRPGTPLTYRQYPAGFDLGPGMVESNGRL